MKRSLGISNFLEEISSLSHSIDVGIVSNFMKGALLWMMEWRLLFTARQLEVSF